MYKSIPHIILRIQNKQTNKQTNNKTKQQQQNQNKKKVFFFSENFDILKIFLKLLLLTCLHSNTGLKLE